jgi:Flp pilus assembly protein TadD
MDQAAAHCAVGDFRDAAALLARVLQADPMHAAAATQLAEIETDHGQYGNAVARLLGVLRARPRHAAALAALSRACLMTDRLDQALQHARDACAWAPADPLYRLQLARVSMRLGESGSARAMLQPLIGPDVPPELAGLAHGLLGEMLEAEGDPAALPHFQAAVQARPADAMHHMSLGIALLRAGRFTEGWAEYAWRSRTLHLRRQALALPDELQWEGQSLRGSTIVLTDEQGIGDAIQFFRYVALVAARGPARLIHVAFPALASLFRMSAPSAEVVEALPFGTNLHYHSTTMGLARVFRTQPDTIPATVPYVLPDPARVAAWAVRLDGAARPRIGLVWSGNPKHQNDAQRSIPAALMLRLINQGASYVGLQPELRPADAAAVSACPRLLDHHGLLTDFGETAALIAGLDLVIAVDTAVAHLAGAMGKPVWVLLPRVADWRWMQDRADSPWYPTARLFRAGLDGWEPVISRVAAALERFTAA